MKPIDILMLDDSESDIYLAKEVLRREKVMNRLHCFSDEEAALEFMANNNVDLVMVDIHLRAGNGLDFIEDATKLGVMGEQPIVVVSGTQDPKIAAQADLLGVDAWIDKPLSVKKLHHLVIHIPSLFMAVVMNKQNMEEVA